jgi:hypothetical protein
MMKVFLMAILFVCSVGPALRASDVATQEEIREDIASAIKRLRSTEIRERLAAIATIQAWRDYAESAVPALTEALGDKDAEVRAEAAHSLELIRSRAANAVPDLMKSLDDPSPSVRAASAFALASIGVKNRAILPLLRKMPRDRSELVSLAAAFAWVRLFPDNAGMPLNRRSVAERAVPLLMSALNEETGYESVRLARAIGVVDPATGYSTLDILINLAESSKPLAGKNAAYALETLGPSLVGYNGERCGKKGGHQETRLAESSNSRQSGSTEGCFALGIARHPAGGGGSPWQNWSPRQIYCIKPCSTPLQS